MSTKGVALSFCPYHAQVLPLRHGVHLRAHTPCDWVPWGVAVSGDSIQAKRRFSKIFKG
jgi:hypothetical protein